MGIKTTFKVEEKHGNYPGSEHISDFPKNLHYFSVPRWQISNSPLGFTLSFPDISKKPLKLIGMPFSTNILSNYSFCFWYIYQAVLSKTGIYVYIHIRTSFRKFITLQKLFYFVTWLHFNIWYNFKWKEKWGVIFCERKIIN